MFSHSPMVCLAAILGLPESAVHPAAHENVGVLDRASSCNPKPGGTTTDSTPCQKPKPDGTGTDGKSVHDPKLEGAGVDGVPSHDPNTKGAKMIGTSCWRPEPGSSGADGTSNYSPRPRRAICGPFKATYHLNSSIIINPQACINYGGRVQ